MGESDVWAQGEDPIEAVHRHLLVEDHAAHHLELGAIVVKAHLARAPDPWVGGGADYGGEDLDEPYAA